MRDSLPDAFIYVKRVKFQVEFPGIQIQFPGSQNALDRIFYTYVLGTWNGALNNPLSILSVIKDVPRHAVCGNKLEI